MDSMAEPVTATVGGEDTGPTYGRRVLLLVTDLFASVGGGQTAYCALVRQRPDTQFYYFIDRERIDAPRPPNAVPIPKNDYYYANVGNLPAEMNHFYSDYLRCWQLARSFVEAAPRVDLDVVDAPDFETLASFIKPALEMHGVRAGTVSLALHGTISSALLDEWGPRTSSRVLAELRMRESLQYRMVDSRYALSESYADELTTRSGGHSPNLIDPLLVIAPFNPRHALPTETNVDVAFIGRRERRKGPDLFIDALWSLDRDSYGRSMVIGGESTGASGVGSAALLESMAKLRGLDVEFVAPMSRPEVDTLFAGPVIVVLPSRYDQFNLVALEALGSGAPAFVSRNAGVSRWIETRLPGLKGLTFELSASRGASNRIRDALADYGGLRQRIIDEVHRRDLQPDTTTLERMYAPAERQCSSARNALADIRHRFDSFNRPRELSKPVDHTNSSGLPAWKKAIVNSPLRPAAELYHRARIELATRLRNTTTSAGDYLESEIADRSPRALDQLRAAIEIEGVRHRALTMGERSRDEIDTKLRTLSADAHSTLIGRTTIFRDMARLERKRGGEIVAATYSLRMMRWLGADSLGDLQTATSALETGGFQKEAVATRAMFESPEESESRIRQLLERQRTDQLSKPTGDFAVFDDRRNNVRPRVAVIVSLYNAASKLATFLEQLGAQSLFRSNDIEIILVDSGSPTNEMEVFQSFADRIPLPILYVRTKERETIQAAWNRGIRLAKAPYLSFLGVDEGVHPDAFRTLADALDEDDTVDWVMADSVVTNVDKNGAFVSDVMTYDRRGYDQSLVYLETCYLSWVGGLYRRSIHDRFGYYDETFRGAGDTEFKSRILPFIRSRHIAKTLGIFLNYPEERTTQHPRAEIEDQRAWYVYRSVPGMEYVWDRKPIAEVERFFVTCLGYRKSYCGHLSTDFDMAHAVALYLVRRAENPEFAVSAVASANAMLDRIRRLETIDMRLSPDERKAIVLRALVEAKRQESLDQSTLGLEQRPRYEIFNDNRYEQHWYSWSS